MARIIFVIHDIWKKIKKWPEQFVFKNQFCHAHQPCKWIFEICFVFLYFFVRASNGSHYSNFGHKCPKLATGTPEDMLFTNLAEATWSSEIGIALLNSNSFLFFFSFWNFWKIWKNIEIFWFWKKILTVRLPRYGAQEYRAPCLFW